VAKNLREDIVQLPGECGQQVVWQVAVRAGSALSNLSAPLSYDLPRCQAYLRVRFDDIYLDWTDDGWPGDKCDTLDAYFQISVRDVTRSFWGGNFFQPLKCGRHYFSDITGGPYKQTYGPEPYVITIPLDTGENVDSIWIKTRFWDHDDWSSDDLFGIHAEHLPDYTPQIGERWPECYLTYTTGGSITDEAKSYLTFTYSIYPNKCRDIPPPEGF
jgi:hypothetical protein